MKKMCYIAGAYRPLILASLLISGLTACSSDDDNDITQSQSSPEPAMIRVIHASADAPAVNVQLNNANAIESFDYAASSGFVSIAAGTYDIDVDGIVPGGLAESVIDVDAVELEEASKTNIIAAGLLANIAPIVVADSTATPTANQVGIQVVHAATAANAVDVYLTEVGADLAAVNPSFNFDFGEAVDAGAVATGTYQIRVTAPGGTDPVYDSGPVDLSPFAGVNLLVVAINTTNAAETAASPVKLLVATDDSQLMLLDTDTNAGLRVVHASVNANTAAGGPVEVFATSAALGADPVELIDAFSYTDIVPDAMSHVSVPAGDYLVDVAPNTNTIMDSVFTSGTLSLSAGSQYSVIASGRVGGDPAFDLWVSAEDARPVVTHAAVRVIHAAPSAGDVDVYVTGAGDFTTAEIEAQMAGTPTLDEFAYGSITDFLTLAPGNYDIRVVAGGLVAINVEGLTLNGSDVISIIARGPEEPMGMLTDFGVLVINN